MPNHIQNAIKFQSKTDAIKVLSAISTKKEDKTSWIDFEKIIPMPENIFRGNLSREDESKYGKENCWYEWSIENWGTKWNVYETALMEDNGKIV